MGSGWGALDGAAALQSAARRYCGWDFDCWTTTLIEEALHSELRLASLRGIKYHITTQTLTHQHISDPSLKPNHGTFLHH